MAIHPKGGELPATARAVLGILSFGEEMTGYDVKRWADQSLAFFYWAPSQSQIYSELRRLEEAGLAISRVEQTHEAKARRLYAITDAGQTAMAEWADDPVLEPVVLKNPAVLRLWAAHNGDRRRLVAMLADHRDESRRRAEKAAAHGRRAQEVPAWHYAALSCEWSAKYWNDEADRIEWMRQRLLCELEEEAGGV
ncbi:PadR family transcriptional regulator [Microbacterium sp. CFH 31415]|uniref:PadR family transcriptional regulator n=1 Tax=Microbacterium sp. CFH 31415 TaxID=2921732 RepID=UPI001F139F74|nr:PadR family transcriptional regulator [Microbacterium sp. CFH 31415]MCH6231642.1 PadR family transcriptional regulator [Microbacterium sp. CFH 31415]